MQAITMVNNRHRFMTATMTLIRRHNSRLSRQCSRHCKYGMESALWKRVDRVPTLPPTLHV